MILIEEGWTYDAYLLEAGDIDVNCHRNQKPASVLKQHKWMAC